MERVRVGLVGAGVMGRIHAASLSHRVDGAELVAVADLDPGKALRCAQELGAEHAYPGYPKMLEDAFVDAVVICTPGTTHAEIIEAAANAGKHVFCEKPIDWDLAAVDRALGAVEKARVTLQIGFQRRFDHEFMRAREAVASGAIGRPHILHLVSRDPAQPYTPRAEGDLFFDSTIHDLDVVRFLTGEEVESVFSMGAAMGRAEEGAGDYPDTAITLLRLSSGAIASIENSRRSSEYDQRVEVFGPRGVVRVENQGVVAPKPDGEAPFFAERYGDAYVAELRSFLDCVRADKPLEVTGRDGRAALVLALAALRSYREGRPVSGMEIS
jgi:myo-inositol 2-dehydrogenase / D-chiro-inositol 1-dehydrogenase